MSACPPAETLSAFGLGELSAGDVDALDLHLAECAECRAILALLEESTKSDTETALPESTDAGRTAKMAARISFLPGERIGDWRIEHQLGSGGMGQVFEVTHAADGRRAAIKVLRADLSSRQEIHRRFARERHVSRRIEHASFVPVLEDGITEDGIPWFAMELVEGSTLRARVTSDGPMTEDAARETGLQLLDAMAAAHAAKVLHRDVKPDNVAIEASGRVRILDFGIARIGGEVEATTGSGATETATGQMLGTPAYMPPEQARAVPALVDERADVYAIAATLVYALTGKPPRAPSKTLYEAMTQPLPPARDLVPGISPAFAHVLDRALAFETRDRWPSATAMRDALASPTTVSAALERAKWTRRAVMALGLAAVVALGAFVTLRLARPGMAGAPLQQEPAPVVAPAAASASSAAPQPSAPVTASAIRAAPSASHDARPSRPPAAAPRPPPARRDPLERRQ